MVDPVLEPAEEGAEEEAGSLWKVLEADLFDLHRSENNYSEPGIYDPQDLAFGLQRVGSLGYSF